MLHTQTLFKKIREAVLAGKSSVWLGLTCLCVISACMYFSPIKRNGFYGSHYFRFILSGVAIGLIWIQFALRKRYPDLGWPSKKNASSEGSKAGAIFYSMLLGASIFACCNYYQFDMKTFSGISDYSDITYYYVNSKYFNELGYFELYPAMLVADKESSNRLSKVKRYRDLHTYKMVKRDDLVLAELNVKDKFSDERWDSFKHDVDYLIKHNISGGWTYFFSDHGYNPPPPWTLVGGFLSTIVPVEQIKSIAALDLLLVLIMFIIIFRTFGADVGLFGMLFFFCTFSGRWPMLGSALLRFDWLVALTLSVCALKKERHATAGALMMYASLNRIFPAIFFWPYAVFALRKVIKTKSIPANIIRFTVGAGSLLVVTLLLVLVFLGPDAIIDSKDNLAMHASPESYSSHRVGLGDALCYQGEFTRRELFDNGGTLAKAHSIEKNAGVIYGLGFIALAFIALYVARSKKPIYELIPLAILPFFCFVTPQINYYNLRLLLIIYHARDMRKFRNVICLILLFSIEVVTQWSHVVGTCRYTTTCITSIGLIVYFSILLLFLISDILKQLHEQGVLPGTQFVKRLKASISPALLDTSGTCLIVVCVMFSAVAPVAYLTTHPKANNDRSLIKMKERVLEKIGITPVIKVSYESINSRKPRGTKWTAAGNIIFRKGSVLINIENDSHCKRLEVGLDNNDSYRIDLLKKAKVVASLNAKTRRCDAGGSSVHILEIPSKAALSGYDAIEITPISGDDRYSISHIILSND